MMNLKQIGLTLLCSLLTPTFLFAASPSLYQVLEPGLNQLFEGRLPESEKNQIVEEARNLRGAYEQALYRLPDALRNIRFVQKKPHLIEFSVPSLVSRPGHPSNNLIGKIYVPTDCPQLHAATLILHHVGDDLGPEEQLANLAVSGKQGIVMLIYLPDYGPRRQGKEAFITNDFSAFQRNVLQALLDTRLAYEILLRQPDVDTKNIKLMGISLGGIIGLMSMGMDPIFSQYGILVGGADIAHIMAFRKEADPNSETSQALKDIHWTVDEARRKLAPLDSLTWAGNVRGKKIMMMNALGDELINPRLGVEKIANLLKANGNQVDVRFHAGGHRADRKTLGIWGLFKDIYMPTMQFISSGQNNNCSSGG